MGKSSKDKRDIYYRLAKEQAWRARSAFKLIQLDEEFDLFSGCTRVVDLCAAPGSWSQVLSRVLVKGEKFGRKAWEEKRAKNEKIIRGESEEHTGDDDEQKVEDTSSSEHKTPSSQRQPIRIVAIDLQPMSPLEGITLLQGDITHPSTIPRILAALNPPSSSSTSSPPVETTQQQQQQQQPVDLIISDGAPDVTGLHDLDIHIQYTLLTSALSLALRILRPGTGKFVAKIFRGKDCGSLIYNQLKVFFANVTIAKPRASRASSLEAFVVCEGYLGVPEGYKLGELGSSSSAMLDKAGGGICLERVDDLDDLDDSEERVEKRRQNAWIPSFIACGDLDAWDDADATTHLPKDHVSLDPVQPPTEPPYKRALELRRQRGGTYGRTRKSQPKNVGVAKETTATTSPKGVGVDEDEREEAQETANPVSSS